MNKIAVFQADHSLQVHTTNVVKGLEAAGYSVDLFLYNCRYIYENTNSVGHVYDLSSEHEYWSKCVSLPTRVLEAFKYFIIDPLRIKSILLPSEAFAKSLKIVHGKNYRCFIGVEKLGFVWAGCLAKLLNIPAIYYSLELYPTRNVFHLSGNLFPFLKALRFLRLRQLEKTYHKEARATIIQDLERANELMRQNNVLKMDNLFLPVSLSGPPVINRSDYLRSVFKIAKEKKIILQFGIIGKNRLAEEVAIASQAFPPDWILIFHGPIGDEKVVRNIRTIDRNNRIILSHDLISTDELDKLISSADIGLCFYGKDHVNDYLTGFSSEKLVRYLRCGVPIVTFDYPTYIAAVENNGCGVCISDLSCLKKAISAILKDYDRYEEKSYETFTKHFEFYSQFQKVISYISQINGSSH